MEEGFLNIPVSLMYVLGDLINLFFALMNQGCKRLTIYAPSKKSRYFITVVALTPNDLAKTPAFNKFPLEWASILQKLRKVTGDSTTPNSIAKSRST
ncbi:hypothetical protein WG904_09555 [Pedobacter sp. Du54]